MSMEYCYAPEAKAWYRAADLVADTDNAAGQAAAALASIAASLIRIGDLLEAQQRKGTGAGG